MNINKYLPFIFLYLMQNVPVTFLMKFMPVYITDQSNNTMSAVAITNMLSIIFLPYLLRFLFSPIVSSFGIKKYYFRLWILIANVGYVLSLLLLMDISKTLNISVLIYALLLNAFFSVVQDIALDGNATRVFTTIKQQNNLSTIQQIFSLSVVPALTVFLYVLYEKTGSFDVILFSLMMPAIVAILFLRKMEEKPYTPEPIKQQYKDIFSFFSKKNMGFLFLLSLYYLPMMNGMYTRPYLASLGFSLRELSIYLDVIPSIVAVITVIVIVPKVLNIFTRQTIMVCTYFITLMQSWIITYMFYIDYINIIAISVTTTIGTISSAVCLICFMAQVMSIARPNKEVIDYSISTSFLYLLSMIIFMVSGSIVQQNGIIESYVFVSIVATVAWVIIAILSKTNPWEEKPHSVEK